MAIPMPMPRPAPAPGNPMANYQAAQDALQQTIAAAQAQRQPPPQKAQPGSILPAAAVIGGKEVMDSLLGSAGSIPATPEVLSINGAPPAQADMGGSMLGNVGAGLGIAKGAYDTYGAFQNGGKGAQTGLGEIGAGVGWFAGGPVGSLVGAGIGNAVGWGAKKLGAFHKTTKEREQERWAGLVEDGVDSQTAQHLFSSAHPEGDTGEGWTPEVEAKAMKNPIDMWGQYGMLQTFGQDYFNKMNEFQRFAATKYAIDNNLLDADRGDIVVTDPERLRGALDEFTNNEDYKKLYAAWKASQMSTGQAQMEAATSYDDMLAQSLGAIQSQANAAVQDAKKQSIVNAAMKPIPQPHVVSSGPIHTGVDSLDNILQGVLA